MSADRALRLEAVVSLAPFHLEAALEVAAGETLAVVGPSGAGKTTCLGVVAGLVRPERGRVSLGEEVWCDTVAGVDQPPYRRHVGYVQQDFALFPHLTVAGNVAYGPRARGAGRREAAAQAETWLARLGLADFASRPVAEISGGQRQRVALARALASGARVLLLDEPLGALDVTTRAAVRAELRSCLAGMDLPTLFVTHDSADALALARRVAVLERGRITQCGTREELLSRPRTAFVAELVGLNHYRAALGGGGELREARVGALVFHVLAKDLSGSASLAFPPSAVTLARERPAGSAQNVFPGRVRDMLPLSDRIRVVVDAGVAMAADITREAAETLALVPGGTVWASVKATAIEVYP